MVKVGVCVGGGGGAAGAGAGRRGELVGCRVHCSHPAPSPATRSPLHASRSPRHHPCLVTPHASCSPLSPPHAAVETFEVKPDDRVLELTLRLAPGAAGRGEALEAAIVGLLDAL